MILMNRLIITLIICLHSLICVASNINLNQYKLNNDLFKTIKIAVITASCPSNYNRITSSLQLAMANKNVDLNISFINSVDIKQSELLEILDEYDGIIIPGRVPGGEAKIGHENQLAAIQFARENNKPILGLRYGLQLMVIEFARNVLHFEDVGSRELGNYKDNIVDLVTHYADPEQHFISLKNYTLDKIIHYNSILSGTYEFYIFHDTKAYKIYNQERIIEGCGNSYVINNNYKNILETNGMIISGVYSNSNVPAIVEYSKHPWFIGVQFHPEIQSITQNLDPIFDSFITHLIENQE